MRSAVAALHKAWRAAGLVLLSVLLLLPAAWAESHALLIGVNEVGVLPPRLRLRGPANDVVLMRQALIGRGMPAHNITVLAQRTPLATAAPTHAEVRQAMNRIAAAVRAGDTVVLHLAGHGVQVPQAANGRRPDGGGTPEPDGLEEVFLLQDSGTWDAARGELPQVLRDDDIGAWIDRLVDGGARVLAIFDTCHAAGMAREPAPFARWRSVAGAELGIPARMTPEVAAAPPAPARQAPRTDGRVLAYAARGHELAGEEWLPRGSSLAQARVQGVFSFEMAGALAAGAGTGAELIATLRERYSAARRLSPTPLVVGDGPLLPP